MKKFFTLIVILAFVAISCCKFHKPKKSSDPKEDPQEQQDPEPEPEPEPDPDPYPEPESNTVEYPFTIKTLEDSTVISFYYRYWFDSSVLTDWTLSQDGGKSWAEPKWVDGEYDSKNADFIIPKAGTKVLIKGNKGKTNECSILFNKDCYVYGNLLSLIHWDDFATRTELTEEDAFSNLFENNYYLLNHPTLDILFPVTTVTKHACYYMFHCCEKLKRAPEIHATNAPYACYEHMFSDCIKLEKAPSVLPAEHVGMLAYKSMFSDCDNLKDPPPINAISAENSAFLQMYYDCKSLEKASSIKMPKFPDCCCIYMYIHCKKLNYVECLTTDLSEQRCTENWLKDVAAEGTFVCAKGMKD